MITGSIAIYRITKYAFKYVISHLHSSRGRAKKQPFSRPKSVSMLKIYE